MEERIKELRGNLTQLINNVKDHSDRLTDWEKLPILEVNVFLAKVNKLYEKTVVLKTILEQQQTGNVTFNADKIHDDIEQVEKEVKAMMPEPKPTESKDTSEQQPETPAPTTQKQDNQPQEVVDKFEDDHAVVDKLRKQPISKLMDAIGLNEKYLYANELFSGDMARFLEFIEKIDQQADVTAALHLFSQYKGQENWDEENETTQELLHLIERRFL